MAAALLLALFMLNLVSFNYTRELWREANTAAPLDWRVYQSAALVVKSHESPHMYDGADDGTDPQQRMAPRDSVITKACHELGLGDTVGMFLYPPLLADLLVPLLAVPPHYEGYVWHAIDLAMLAVCFALAIQLTGTRRKWAVWLVLLLWLPTLRTVVDAVYTGQVSILLTLLWVAAAYCYRRNWFFASALFMAFATWLKLTPLLVIVPFFIWKEWRWMRWYLVNMLGLLATLCVVNGPHMLSVFFLRVMPAMARGKADPWNRTFVSYLQLVYEAAHGVTVWGDPNHPPLLAPMWTVQAGKLLSFAVLAAFIVLLYRKRGQMDVKARVAVLLATSLLAQAIAPVSWTHSYVMLVPVLIVMWVQTFREEPRVWGWAVLAWSTLVLAGTFWDHLIAHLHSSFGETALMLMWPMMYAALCFYMVLRFAGLSAAEAEA